MPVILSVLIPSVDRPERLGRLLASLAAQRGADPAAVEVRVAWHAGSRRARAAYLRLLAAPPRPVVAFARAEGDGPSAFRNALARAATAPLLLFLDDDTEAHPDLAAATLEHARSTADDLFGGRVVTLPPPGASPALARALRALSTTWHAPARDGEGRVRFIPGLLLAARREALLAAGGFDERLRVAEDSELCLRMHARGANLGDCPAMVARHLGPPTLAALLTRIFRYGVGNGALRRRDAAYPRPAARTALAPLRAAGSPFDLVRLLAYHAGQAAGFVLG